MASTRSKPAAGSSPKRIRKSTKQTDKRAAMRVALELAKEAATKTREITLGDALTAYVDQMQADGKTSWKDARLKAEKTTGAFEPGNEDRWGGRFYGWKGKKERTIPMVDEMFERRAKMPRGAYVFPGKDGKARTGPTRAITRAMTKEGLNDAEVVEAFGRATNHSLRHTYGSWLRQRGLGLGCELIKVAARVVC